MSGARRVLIVDDERNVRSLLEIGLGDEGFDVRSVPDGQAALHAVREWDPHAIVLDWMMPKVDGVTLLPMLRKLTEAPILMLTAKNQVPDRIEALGAGADDYVPKPFDIAELAARIEAALRRPTLARRTTLSVADLEVDTETRMVARAGRSIDLSAREFDLLVALMRYPRRVFTRDELLDRVWGNERIVGQGTVETYISYLRAKLDHGFERRLIHTHRGAGYSLRDT